MWTRLFYWVIYIKMSGVYKGTQKCWILLWSLAESRLCTNESTEKVFKWLSSGGDSCVIVYMYFEVKILLSEMLSNTFS